MKRSELKKALKPLIKECVKEVMFEDGILSGIISEVARGMSAPTPEREPKASPILERMNQNAFKTKKPSAQLQEQKSKLMAAIGADAYNGIDLFQGTTPGPAQTSLTEQANPLSGMPAGDPGVDISTLFGSVGKSWGAHMEKVKETEK